MAVGSMTQSDYTVGLKSMLYAENFPGYTTDKGVSLSSIKRDYDYDISSAYANYKKQQLSLLEQNQLFTGAQNVLSSANKSALERNYGVAQNKVATETNQFMKDYETYIENYSKQYTDLLNAMIDYSGLDRDTIFGDENYIYRDETGAVGYGDAWKDVVSSVLNKSQTTVGDTTSTYSNSSLANKLRAIVEAKTNPSTEDAIDLNSQGFKDYMTAQGKEDTLQLLYDEPGKVREIFGLGADELTYSDTYKYGYELKKLGDVSTSGIYGKFAPTEDMSNKEKYDQTKAIQDVQNGKVVKLKAGSKDRMELNIGNDTKYLAANLITDEAIYNKISNQVGGLDKFAKGTSVNASVLENIKGGLIDGKYKVVTVDGVDYAVGKWTGTDEALAKVGNTIGNVLMDEVINAPAYGLETAAKLTVAPVAWVSKKYRKSLWKSMKGFGKSLAGVESKDNNQEPFYFIYKLS